MKQSVLERLNRLERKVDGIAKRQAKVHAWYALFRTVMQDNTMSAATKLERLGTLLAQLDKEFPE